jgi:hypothetical protein
MGKHVSASRHLLAYAAYNFFFLAFSGVVGAVWMIVGPETSSTKNLVLAPAILPVVAALRAMLWSDLGIARSAVSAILQATAGYSAFLVGALLAFVFA